MTNEGAGLGAAPVLLEMIAAGKVSRALRAFLGAIGDSDPEAPKLTEAEAKHALRNGRSFMANEYGITMTCVPDWDSVRASKTVAAVLLGELSPQLLAYEPCLAGSLPEGSPRPGRPGRRARRRARKKGAELYEPSKNQQGE